MVDVAPGGRGNGAIRREAVPPLRHRGPDTNVDQGPPLPHAHTECRFREGCRRLDVATRGRWDDRSQELPEIRQDRGTIHGTGPSGRPRTYRRHLPLDEAE